jgi:hypothetical protein
MFEKGQTNKSKAMQLMNEHMCDVRNKLIDKFNNNKLIVYGAGKLGGQIGKFINENSIETVQAFVVSDIYNNPENIENIPVKDYTEYIKGTEKIVIALYDNIQAKEIYNLLINQGVEKDRLIILNSDEKIFLHNI